MNKNKIISELLNSFVKVTRAKNWCGTPQQGYYVYAPQTQGATYCVSEEVARNFAKNKKIELLDMAIEAAKESAMKKVKIENGECIIDRNFPSTISIMHKSDYDGVHVYIDVSNDGVYFAQGGIKYMDMSKNPELGSRCTHHIIKSDEFPCDKLKFVTYNKNAIVELDVLYL